ncbi:hypothetical protein SAMN05428944_6005 [Streptomyces sp. 1222.5]|uniref:hypothetical protein n=1 Tax=unclassified Streptomyces TaxID=2593676 RepID=UPI000894C17A|nr:MULTISPECIES: hypothetical protein [unclassified Streptomyces]PKW06930.1 hypothetical protein BX260_2091 [Streptomyces sp. 5112.2]SEC71538.1 hypothetical protein SAMN05216532_2194 [Streptomyces sp. 2231.1]SED02167.1 hypothetical protein SAMN05428944_6005 [Streptomyces sp. 1222.5]
MRLSRSLAPLTVAVALVLCLPYDAMSHVRAGDGKPPAPGLFGAACRTSVDGSHVVAYCHNPYVDTDRVRLHIECARWWDIDTDSAPVDAGPAMTVRLTGRCWKDVGSVWVSHQKVR